MVLTKLLQERVLKHLNFEEVNLTTRLKQSFSMHNCKQTYSDKIGHCRYEIPSPRRIAATDKHSHGSHMEVTWKDLHCLEAYSGICQMSNIELFAKTVNGSALNYLLKKFHLKMFNKVPNTSLLFVAPWPSWSFDTWSKHVDFQARVVEHDVFYAVIWIYVYLVF